MSMKVRELKTAKKRVFRRQSQLNGLVPSHHNIALFSGAKGSGKTNALVNLLLNPIAYGKSLESNYIEEKPRGYFDEIFLLTASKDDLYDNLIDEGLLRESNVRENPTEEDLTQILSFSKEIIKKVGFEKSPRILIIYDDVLNCDELLKSDSFKESFVNSRHANCSIWFSFQYLYCVPKYARQQADFIFAFKPHRADFDVLAESYMPMSMDKKSFQALVKYATKEPYSFLTYCKNPKQDAMMFRKNFDEFIPLDDARPFKPLAWDFVEPTVHRPRQRKPESKPKDKPKDKPELEEGKEAETASGSQETSQSRAKELERLIKARDLAMPVKKGKSPSHKRIAFRSLQGGDGIVNRLL